MYCSTCGKTINPGLSFCNHCGTRVGGASQPSEHRMSEASFNLLIVALIAVPILGIGVIIGLMSVMKGELNFKDEMIAIVVLMSFILLLTTEFSLIWLLHHHTKPSKKKDNVSETQPFQIKDVEIKGLPEGNIQGFTPPIPSVTEHTTRTLDPVPRKHITE